MNTLALAPTQVLADHADHWNGPGAWWPIFPLLWFVMIFAFIFFLTRFGWRRRCYDERWRTDGSGAGRVRLAERFAAGEIDEPEYRARLAVLEESVRRDPR